MTLILSHCSRAYALQVSDRLVTTDASTHDAVSNKSIVLVATDGVVAISYSGVAYVNRTPTDQWIVETLTGIRYDRDRKPWSWHGGPHKNARRDIGWLLRMLSSELEHVGARLETNSRATWTRVPFYLVGCGWQWTSRGRYRPVVVWVDKESKTEQPDLWWKERHWYLDREGGAPYTISPTPPSYFWDKQLAAMAQAICGMSVGQVEAALIREIRVVAARNRRVGPDCMSILIPPPSVGEIHVRYWPLVKRKSTVRVGREQVLVDLAYTPWIVTPGGVHAPSVSFSCGERTMSCGGFCVIFHPLEGASPVSSGRWNLQAILAGQQRPPPP